MLNETISKRIKSPVNMTLILLTVLLLFTDYHFRWKKDQWTCAVHTDAANYYRYLPMVFIEGKLDDQIENPRVIKHFVGTAVLYSPFFAIACAGSYISGLPVDGYSLLFPVMISIGTLFYFIFGLFFFARFLRYYISRDWIICVTMVALTFGTVAYYYTVIAPGWAHIPAFAIISFLLFHLKKITVDFKPTSVIAIIAGSSFLFFIRPTDITIILIAPFLAADLNAFLNTIRKIWSEKKAIGMGILLALIPLACQLGIYKASTGEFFVWSYTKEGFDFLHPQIANVLFSYAKGFFIYTPICFISLFGLFRLFKISPYLFSGVVLYITINIYIISSWWCWNYGYSYGPRAFIEHYPIFFFLLGLLLNAKSKVLKFLTGVSISFCIFLNLFQTYQVLWGILDQDFKTDKKGYWHTFLSMKNGYSGKFYRFPVDENPGNIVRRITWFNDMEQNDTAWLNSNSRVTEKAYSGVYSSKVDKNNNFSVGLRKKLSEIPYARNVIVRASGWFYVPRKNTGAYFAISFVTDGKAVSFNPVNLDGSIDNFGEWQYITDEIYMPKLPERVEQNPGSVVEFYYFNNSETPCYVDDLKIEFIEFKEMERVLDLSWD
jgi:hypothetical protein